MSPKVEKTLFAFLFNAVGFALGALVSYVWFMTNVFDVKLDVVSNGVKMTHLIG